MVVWPSAHHFGYVGGPRSSDGELARTARVQVVYTPSYVWCMDQVSLGKAVKGSAHQISSCPLLALAPRPQGQCYHLNAVLFHMGPTNFIKINEV